MAATTNTYAQQQIAELPDSEFYRMKVKGDHDGETKWINVTPAQLAQIWLIMGVDNFTRDAVGCDL